MTRSAPPDPLKQLNLAERRRWRSAERQVERDHEAEQLETLRSLAAKGSGVTGMITGGSSAGWTDSVEMIIEGRRVRGNRVHRPTLAALKDALSSIASVPLSAATRYGPYWVLTFKTAAEPLVVLVDRLTIVPDWGGGLARAHMPTGPAWQMAS